MVIVNFSEGVMFKKISYLVSVSVLTSVLMGSTSHAIHEGDLLIDISNFYEQRKSLSIKAVPQVDQEQKAPSTWWDTISYAGEYIKPVLTGTGHTLRYLGDQLRGDNSFVGDLLTEKGLEAASGFNAYGVAASSVVKRVESNEGVLTHLRSVIGNSTRYVGGLLAGETPTLARALRHVWIDKYKIKDKPETIFTSTACALFLSREVKGIEEVTEFYRQFVKAWNANDFVVRSNDTGNNAQWFLNGIIRGYARTGIEIKEGQMLLSQFQTYFEEFPMTREINEGTVFPSEQIRSGKTIIEIRDSVKAAREDAFLKYVVGQYGYESEKFKTNMYRQAMIQHSSVPSRLAIEPVPSAALTYVPSADPALVPGNGGGIRIEEIKSVDQSNMESVD